MEEQILKFLPKKNQWMILLLIGLLLVVIAMPTKTNSQEDNEYVKAEEMRLKQILEQMEGVGRVDVMMSYLDEEKVEGVVVIADGAENSMVVQRITEVVQALFDVEMHKIKVMKGGIE